MNSKFILMTQVRHLLLVASLLLLSSCAGERAYRQGVDLADNGQVEEGLQKIEQAIREAPENPEYRLALANRRLKAINELLAAADSALNQRSLDEAEEQYNRILNLDKNNTRAQTGVRQVMLARAHAELVAAAQVDLNTGNLVAVHEKIQAVLLENPKQPEALALRAKLEEKMAGNKLSPPTLIRYTNPVTLEFRDAPVKMVFDVLSSTAGVNFILDKDLRPEQRVSIFVKQVTFDRALNLLLDANQLDKKIINENTAVIYPRTPQKAQEYEELMVKTFYLANADPKQTANLVKTILKVRDVFVDDRLNMLVIRDSPETIRLVEKLIAAQDLPEPEVLLDVTVVEVKRGRLLDLGIQPPTELGILPSLDADNKALPLTLRALGNLNQGNISVGGATPKVNINEQISDVNILANPRIRVRNREKAKIQVGDRVPVVSTTTPVATSASSTETVSYLDTGIKLEVKPNIYLDGDVAIEIALEVNSLGEGSKTNNGTTVYRIGTRNATTLLRLKDGETQLLGGLINDEDRSFINGLPGLADLPLIGRLFASHQDLRQKSELVLSITPHIIRNLERPNAGVIQFWSGTETGGQGSYQGSYGDEFMPRGREPGFPPVPPAQPTSPALVQPEPTPLPVPEQFPAFRNPGTEEPPVEEPPVEEPPAEEPPVEEPSPELPI